MLTTIIVICVVSFALIAGALWGVYGNLSNKTEGFLVALAGGALMVSAVLELIQPALENEPIITPLIAVFTGAIVFTILDFYVKEKWSTSSGGSGLLAAITLDGLPENLALGVALISADPLTVAALSGSIVLSNLPEAAGGAKEMKADGRSSKSIIWLWTATAIVLSIAALVGYFFFDKVSNDTLDLIRCFAGGAVVASLAIEVFPKAFKEDKYWTGLATAIGLVLAFYLNTLGG